MELFSLYFPYLEDKLVYRLANGSAGSKDQGEVGQWVNLSTEWWVEVRWPDVSLSQRLNMMYHDVI